MAVIPNLTIAVYPTDFEGRITLQDIIDTVAAAGGGEGPSITWSTLEGKPATFPPTIGTTATTAKAGNWNPPAGSTTAAGLLQIGTGATQAAAGNHTHAAATTSAAGMMSAADKTKLDGIATGATALTIGTTATTAAAGNHTHSNYATTAALADLVSRVAALEAAATP